MMKNRHKLLLLVQIMLGISCLCAAIKARRQLLLEKKKNNKYSDLYKLMAQWIEAMQNGQLIADWLKTNKYMSVAIYGMSLIGERLYIELADQGIQVAYGVDRLSRDYLDGIKMYQPCENLPEADAVIVTAVSDYDMIREQLHEKVDCPVISFRDIVDEMLIQ